MCRGLNRDVMVDLQFWHEDCFARNATLDARRSTPGTMDRAASQRKNFLNTRKTKALKGDRNAAAPRCQRLSDAGVCEPSRKFKGENNAFE